MQTSGHLKSGDSFLALAPLPPPLISRNPNPNSPPPPQEWLRTLYEVLHEIHTIKICIHHCNEEIVFVSD